MKVMIVIAGAVLVSACSSVTPITNDHMVLDYSERCSVTVYQTEADALKGGEIEELCVIDGTSSGSFNHSSSTAIKKQAQRRTGKKILTQHTGLPPRDDGSGKPSRANKKPRNRGSRD